MSRYEWQENGKEFSIGWDKPMNTFFAQVHNPGAKSDNEYCELWLGQTDSAFTELTDLLAKFPGEISNDLSYHLISDQLGLAADDRTRILPQHITARF